MCVCRSTLISSPGLQKIRRRRQWRLLSLRRLQVSISLVKLNLRQWRLCQLLSLRPQVSIECVLCRISIACVLYRMCSLQNVSSRECVLYRRVSIISMIRALYRICSLKNLPLSSLPPPSLLPIFPQHSLPPSFPTSLPPSFPLSPNLSLAR